MDRLKGTIMSILVGRRGGPRPLPARHAMLLASVFAGVVAALVAVNAGGDEHPADWYVSYGEDRITGERTWTASSGPVYPEDELGDRRSGAEGWIGFFCDRSGEGAFLGFSSVPNLIAGSGRRELPVPHSRVRTRWNQDAIVMMLRHEPGSATLEFVDSADVNAVRLPDESRSVLIELPWHDEELVYFRYSLEASSGPIKKVRSECRHQGTLPKARAGTEAPGLARRIAWAKISAEHEARKHRELELARRGAEEDRRELIAREQQRLEQERKAIFAKALEEYIGAIQSSVARNWRRPSGVPPGLKCTVNVVQATNGQVLRVEIAQSSGNVKFDRSVEQAVLAASPLPPPKQRAVFDREIVFLFNPRS